MFFHPGVPRFRRGVVVLSTFTCSLVGLHVLMGDFGTQRHVFSSAQAYITPKIDEFFGIKAEEIEARRLARRVVVVAPAPAAAVAKK